MHSMRPCAELSDHHAADQDGGVLGNGRLGSHRRARTDLLPRPPLDALCSVSCTVGCTVLRAAPGVFCGCGSHCGNSRDALRPSVPEPTPFSAGWGAAPWQPQRRWSASSEMLAATGVRLGRWRDPRALTSQQEWCRVRTHVILPQDSSPLQLGAPGTGDVAIFGLVLKVGSRRLVRRPSRGWASA